jgi:hypothetical protein
MLQLKKSVSKVAFTANDQIYCFYFQLNISAIFT